MEIDNLNCEIDNREQLTPNFIIRLLDYIKNNCQSFHYNFIGEALPLNTLLHLRSH